MQRISHFAPHHIPVICAALVASLFMLSSCPTKPKAPTTAPTTPTTAPPAQQTPESAPPAEQPVSRPNVRPAGETWVYTEKLDYRIGEPIKVEYKVKPAAEGRPWIGLVPNSVKATDSGSNDAEDVTYAYVEPAQQGTVELIPPKTGEFYIRLFDGDNAQGQCQGESPVISVRDWEQGSREANRPPLLTVTGEQPPSPVKVKAGATITVNYELPEAYPDRAWIGLIPASEKSWGEGANDAVDVTYAYIPKGATLGSVDLVVEKPGQYVVRLFPCDIGEASCVFESVPIVAE